MPFKSAAQRRLFHAAKKNPAIRRKHGMTMATIDEMIGADTGGKLPKKKRKKRRKKR